MARPRLIWFVPYNHRGVESLWSGVVMRQISVNRIFLFLLLFGFVAALVGVGGSAHAADAKSGYLIDVPVPLTARAATRLISQLEELAADAPQDGRLDVVLRYSQQGGSTTAFEDGLKVARAITGDTLRPIRVISLVESEVSGHSVLPILASDTLTLSKAGNLSDATAGETSDDETIRLTYQSIASRRGVFPTSVVAALVDPSVELAWVTKVGGSHSLASGDQLVKLRETGQVLSEEVWSASGIPASLTADQLRSARIAAGVVGSIDEAAELLDLAKIIPLDSSDSLADASGVLMEISGSVSRGRVRRWQSNLSGSLSRGDVNTWLVRFDSIGGDLDQSASLASLFAIPEPPLRKVIGFVATEARGDSALMAVACKPLYLAPDAVLGGVGADQISLADLDNHTELINEIARATGRPAGLIRGLLCPDLEVFRYSNLKTGTIRYQTPEELVGDSENPDLERDRWKKGEQIDFSGGVDVERAMELGLVEGSVNSLQEVAQRNGMSEVPKLVSDRGLVRFVERMGRSRGLMMLLLMIGFISLSAEMNAPGMGVPGFFALVCFGLFFWMNYLAGTAEWLELVLLVLGLGCIAMEVLVIPGFGIFGIGGLLMTIAAIVLMSQTFVIPQNSYQLGVITRGLWAALGSLLGLFGGFVLMRQLFPHVPMFRHLIMEAPDVAAIDQAEKLVDFGFLLHKVGTTTTPLRPSGKARFGDEIVQVVSEGTMVEKGSEVTVIEVHGAKVVVESLS